MQRVSENIKRWHFCYFTCAFKNILDMANHFTAKNKFLYKEFVVKYPSCLPSFMKKKKMLKRINKNFHSRPIWRNPNRCPGRAHNGPLHQRYLPTNIYLNSIFQYPWNIIIHHLASSDSFSLGLKNDAWWLIMLIYKYVIRGFDEWQPSRRNHI